MVKPIDITKFRKNLTKTIPGISAGFHDPGPDDWVSTGSYGLNYLLSGDFYKGVPLGKFVVLAGESGSGKSFISSGNIAKNAQEKGMFVLLIDSENALDNAWLEALGVDTSEGKLLKLNMSMINDVSKTIFDFIEIYKSDHAETPRNEMPKVVIIIDSLGMLQTPVSTEQAKAGDLRGDMGWKAKQLKALVSNCVGVIAPFPILILATNHTYSSQDQFNPDAVISGGGGAIFAASMVVVMNKLKLKEDDEGNKISDVVGIRAVCKVMKTRYSKPFETIKLNIPYSSGMNPISGLFDLFEKTGVLKKEGNRYSYTSKATGEIMKYFRKEWNDFEKMKVIMDEFTQDDLQVKVSVSDTNDSSEE